MAPSVPPGSMSKCSVRRPGQTGLPSLCHPARVQAGSSEAGIQGQAPRGHRMPPGRISGSCVDQEPRVHHGPTASSVGLPSLLQTCRAWPRSVAPPHPEHAACTFPSLPFAGTVPPSRRAPALWPTSPLPFGCGPAHGLCHFSRATPMLRSPRSSEDEVPGLAGEWDPSECLSIAGARPGRLCALRGSPAP